MSARTRISAVAAAVLIAAVAAACGSTTSGQGSLAGPLSTGSSASGSSAPGSSTPAPSLPVGPATPATLSAALEPAPAGSHPWSTAWGANTTPTLLQFVQYDYDAADVTSETQRLTAEGLHAIAHRTWVAPDSNQADVILLGFADTTGAQARYDGGTQARLGAPGITRFALPGAAASCVATREAGIDKLGNVKSLVYCLKGSVVLELFAFTTARLDVADVAAWTNAQVALLP